MCVIPPSFCLVAEEIVGGKQRYSNNFFFNRLLEFFLCLLKYQDRTFVFQVKNQLFGINLFYCDIYKLFYCIGDANICKS